MADMPGTTAKKGLIEDFSSKQDSVIARQLGVNKDNELRTKVSSGIQTKGLSGAQKWKAALEKIEEDDLTNKAEKERIWEGPEAKEVEMLMNTLELSLCLDPKSVEGEGMAGLAAEGHKWDGMVGLAVGFLWSRTYDADSMKEMVGDKDGIRILLELMMHYHYEPEIVQNCCGCLASVCLNKDNREMFRQVGGCKIITDLLAENRPNFSKYPQLPYNFCSVIKVIAVDFQCQVQFTKVDAHELILKIMEGQEVTDYVMEEASSALANMIADPLCVRPVAVESRGLQRILQLISTRKTRGNPKVMGKMVKIVWNFTDEESLHDLCFMQGVPTVMKELCDSFQKEPEVLMEIFGVLRNMSHVRDLSRKQLNERQKPLMSAIPNIMDALEHAHIAGVQVRAIGFLMNVSDDEAFKTVLMTQHVLESVIIALRNTPDYLPMQRIGCSLLCNLTSGSTFIDGCDRIKKVRGMMHIKKLMHNNPNDYQLMRAAIGLCRNICCVSPKHREYIAEKHELIPVVMGAMRRHIVHPILCRNACSMLSAVCAEPIYAWEVSKRGGCKLCCNALEAAMNMKPRDRQVLVEKILLLMTNLCCVQVGLEKVANALNGTATSGDPGRKKLIQQVVDEFPDSEPIQEHSIRLIAVAEEYEESLIEKAVPQDEREFYMYVVGGHSDPHHLDTGEKLDTRTMKWGSIPKMLHRRYHPSAVFSPDGRYLYCFGGHNEDEKLDSVEVLDLGTVGAEWVELEPMPSKRSHVAGALQPRSPYIYAVGGNDGSGPETGRLSSVIRFNMETNHWEPWGEMTTVRSAPGISFCLDGEFLYVAGGSDGSKKLKSAERLQIARNKWETLPDMSSARSGCCAATGADNCFYVIGGYDGTDRMDTTEYFDPDYERWIEGPKMIKRRSGADATTGPDGSIFVAGGTDGVQQHGSIEVLRFANGKPTRWSLVTEMQSRRECGAIAFSLTKPIPIPLPKDPEEDPANLEPTSGVVEGTTSGLSMAERAKQFETGESSAKLPDQNELPREPRKGRKKKPTPPVEHAPAEAAGGNDDGDEFELETEPEAPKVREQPNAPKRKKKPRAPVEHPPVEQMGNEDGDEFELETVE